MEPKLYPPRTRIVAERHSRKLSQGDAATLLKWGNVGRQRLSDIENGHRNPTDKEKEDLAYHFEIEVEAWGEVV